MPPESEIALAESAAPPAIAKAASIFLLHRGGCVLERQGSNAFTCFVARTAPGEIEPIRYEDEQKTHTLVAREFVEQQLREKKLNDAAVDAEIGQRCRGGELQPNQNFGMAYMLSPCNRVMDQSGQLVGEHPHLTFHAPYATNRQRGLSMPSEHGGSQSFSPQRQLSPRDRRKKKLHHEHCRLRPRQPRLHCYARNFALTEYQLVGSIPSSWYGNDMTSQIQHESKTKLLDAALHVIRAKGYAATTIDDICHKAEVTKGSFFHHFKSKDELAIAAASYWATMTEGFFAAAPYRKLQDPLQRLFGYVDLRGEILQGDLPDCTCLLGTLVQETYATHPDIRAACDQGMSSHIAELTRDVEAAKKLYAPKARWSAESVGYFIQAVLQGGFILAKAKQNPDVVRESLAHLRRYLEALFNQPRQISRKEK